MVSNGELPKGKFRVEDFINEELFEGTDTQSQA